MASPSPGLDIEAQTNIRTDTWPENIPASAALSPLSANPQLSTTPEPPAQHTNTSQHHYENAGRKTTDNSRVHRGIFDFPFSVSRVVISFLSQTRTMETLLMGSGRCTSRRRRSRIKRLLRVGREIRMESLYS